MPAYFESGVFNRRGAWHGLGNVWTPENENDVLTPALALELSGLDWEVDLEPIKRNERDTGKFWTVRRSDDQEFGVVGSQYKVIQNVEGFDYLTNLVESSDIEIETAISIYGGRVVTLLARKPGHIKVGDDDFDTFIGFTNRHDGLGACKVFTCRERVVCANTQAIAEGEFKKSGRNWTIRHQGDTELKLAEARAALELSFEEDVQFQAALDRMLNTPLTKDSYKNTMVEVVGLRQIDKVKQQRAYRRAKDTAMRIDTIRRTTDNLDDVKNTNYGLFQAITQYETHERKFRNDGTKFQKLAVEGGEYTNRAFALLS